MENTIINGYTIQYKLGEGGMAEVWYAENILGKPVAIKILQKKLCGDKEVVQRFENEARLMVQLSHPHIRNIYDFSTVDNRPCMLMEYLQGKDLSKRLQSGEIFSNEQLITWWNDLTDALHYTHQKNIIHRDIKPSNLFVTETGTIKVLDFGIAKIKDNISVTQTGSRMGTLLYMSPEQVYDIKALTYKTDLYSLAVTFFHLVSGMPPYDTTKISDFEIQENIVHKNLDTSALPFPWRNFLPDYLFKNAAERKELRNINLSELQNNKTVAPPRPAVPAYYPVKRKSNAWMYFFLFFILIGGAVILGKNKNLLSKLINENTSPKTNPKTFVTPAKTFADTLSSQPPIAIDSSAFATATGDNQQMNPADMNEKEITIKNIISDYYNSRSDCNTLYRFFADTVKQYYKNLNEPLASAIQECENYHLKWQFVEADIRNESYIFTHYQNGEVSVDYSMLYKIKQSETDDWIPYDIDVSMVFDENMKISRIVETRIEKL
jgi:serine/threonine-protein kinase